MEKENLGSRIEQLEVLREQYGNYDDIPNAELHALNYRRVGPGHLAPMGVEVVNINDAWENKQANRPFDQISFEVAANQEAVSHLDQIKINRISRLFYLLDPFGGNIEFLPPNSPVTKFRDAFNEWANTVSPEVEARETLDFLEDEVEAELFWALSAVMSEEINQIFGLVEGLRVDFPDLITIFDLYSYGDSNTKNGGAENLWQYLEKFRAKATDREVAMDNFSKRMEATNQNILYSWGVESDDERLPFYEGLSKKPPVQVINYYLGEFLKDQQLTDVASSLNLSNTVSESVAILERSTKDCERLQNLYQTLAEYKKQSQNLSRPEKFALSPLINQTKAELKNTKQMLRGMKDYFELPKIACDYFDRTIKEILSLLIRTVNEEAIKLTLDGRYDKNKDKDPGKLSGDCTEGRPLPFDDPNVPIYNVKVYEKNQHIGNIYLLATKSKLRHQDEKLNWHLEAIQIPSYKINWSEFPARLVAALEPVAKSKGVAYITVNYDAETISNYDYIGKAFQDFFGSDASEVVWAARQYPKNPDDSKYSHFQGSQGMAPAIWRNTDKK